MAKAEKPKKKVPPIDSEAYREVIERAAVLYEEAPELDEAPTAEAQVEMFKELETESIREENV